jgi:hypothetical protein
MRVPFVFFGPAHVAVMVLTFATPSPLAFMATD